MGPTPERLTEVGREHTNIRSRTAVDGEFDLGRLAAKHLSAIDTHPLRLTLDLLALSRKFVERHSGFVG